MEHFCDRFPECDGKTPYQCMMRAVRDADLNPGEDAYRTSLNKIDAIVTEAQQGRGAAIHERCENTRSMRRREFILDLRNDYWLFKYPGRRGVASTKCLLDDPGRIFVTDGGGCVSYTDLEAAYANALRATKYGHIMKRFGGDVGAAIATLATTYGAYSLVPLLGVSGAVAIPLYGVAIGTGWAIGDFGNIGRTVIGKVGQATGIIGAKAVEGAKAIGRGLYDGSSRVASLGRSVLKHTNLGRRMGLKGGAASTSVVLSPREQTRFFQEVIADKNDEHFFMERILETAEVSSSIGKEEAVFLRRCFAFAAVLRGGLGVRNEESVDSFLTRTIAHSPNENAKTVIETMLDSGSVGPQSFLRSVIKVYDISRDAALRMTKQTKMWNFLEACQRKTDESFNLNLPEDDETAMRLAANSTDALGYLHISTEDVRVNYANLVEAFATTAGLPPDLMRYDRSRKDTIFPFLKAKSPDRPYAYFALNYASLAMRAFAWSAFTSNDDDFYRILLASKPITEKVKRVQNVLETREKSITSIDRWMSLTQKQRDNVCAYFTIMSDMEQFGCSEKKKDAKEICADYRTRYENLKKILENDRIRPEDAFKGKCKQIL